MSFTMQPPSLGRLPGPSRPQDPPADGACAECEGGTAAASRSTGTIDEFSASSIVDTSDFPARWNCGTWSDLHGWLHIVADVGIWIAYMALPAFLIYCMRIRRDWPFPRLVALFAAFILLCGFTHALEAMMFWWPAYRLMGIVKLVTALVSIATVLTFVPLIPKALMLRSPKQLEEEVKLRTQELRVNEQQLVVAREAAESAALAKADFLANMSHEIRTPLAAILGFSELVQDEPDRATEMSEVIERNARHLLHILNDILDITKIEAGKLETNEEPVDPRLLANEVVGLMRGQAQAKRLRLVVNCAADVPDRVVGDNVRLRQILLNLVGNAVKFTDNGSVTLSVQGSAGSDQLEFLIEDTGPGMTQEQADRIFHAFEQVGDAQNGTRGGTGLGLTISGKLAQMMGGSVSVRETKVQLGTTFCCAIPMRQVTAAPVASPEPRKMLPRDVLAGHRVLVVDDMPDNRLLARRTLEAVGAEVIEANDGQQGLDRVEELVGAGVAPDIVLADLNMPNVDGHQMARQLRERGYAGKIIAVTADVLAEAVIRDGGNVFDGVFVKPIRQREMAQAVAGYLKGDSFALSEGGAAPN